MAEIKRMNSAIVAVKREIEKVSAALSRCKVNAYGYTFVISASDTNIDAL
jgi:hypothetical protein